MNLELDIVAKCGQVEGGDSKSQKLYGHPLLIVPNNTVFIISLCGS